MKKAENKENLKLIGFVLGLIFLIVLLILFVGLNRGMDSSKNKMRSDDNYFLNDFINLDKSNDVFESGDILYYRIDYSNLDSFVSYKIGYEIYDSNGDIYYKNLEYDIVENNNGDEASHFLMIILDGFEPDNYTINFINDGGIYSVKNIDEFEVINSELEMTSPLATIYDDGLKTIYEIPAFDKGDEFYVYFNVYGLSQVGEFSTLNTGFRLSTIDGTVIYENYDQAIDSFQGATDVVKIIPYDTSSLVSGKYVIDVIATDALSLRSNMKSLVFEVK